MSKGEGLILSVAKDLINSWGSPRVILRNGNKTKSDELARRISRGVYVVAARCFGSALLTSYSIASQHDAAIMRTSFGGFFGRFAPSE